MKEREFQPNPSHPAVTTASKNKHLQEAIRLDEKRKSILEQIDKIIHEWDKTTIKKKGILLNLIKFDVRFLKPEQLQIVREALEKVGIIPGEKFDEFVKQGYEIDGIEDTIETETKRKWLTGLELIEQPIIEPPSPIGKGFLVPERYTIFAGKDGEGKTTLLTQLTLSAITGIPLLGIFPIPEPVKVLYFCGENSRGDIKNKIAKQIPEIEKLSGRNIKEDLKLRLRIVEPLNVDFFLDGRLRENEKRLERYLEQTNPDIVIFDPLSNFIASEQSISKDQVARPVAKRLNEIARQFNCFPILTTHFKKDTKEPPENIMEMIHGSRYWINMSASQVAIKRAYQQMYPNAKTMYTRFKTEPPTEPYLINFNRDTLWYEEINKEKLKKVSKLRPKDAVEVLERKGQGHMVRSILVDVLSDELGCKKRQAQELIAASLSQGLIKKEKGELKVINLHSNQVELSDKEKIDRERDKKDIW